MMTAKSIYTAQGLLTYLQRKAIQRLIYGRRGCLTRSISFSFVQDCTGTCLVYCVNKELCVVLEEVIDHFNLIWIREDQCDSGDALVRSEALSDKFLPSRDVPVKEATPKSNNGLSSSGRGADRDSKIFNASAAFGREGGSCAQQRSTNDHKFSVNIGCVGRGGRLPSVTDSMAIKVEISLNGTSPVNTWVKMRRSRTSSGLIVAHLNHDHRKREHICFLGVRPFIQDLRRRKSWGITMVR
jgi:hypothetical protein